MAKKKIGKGESVMLNLDLRKATKAKQSATSPLGLCIINQFSSVYLIVPKLDLWSPEATRAAEAHSLSLFKTQNMLKIKRNFRCSFYYVNIFYK